MHVSTDPVSNKVFYGGESGIEYEGFHLCGDFAPPFFFRHQINRDLQRLFRNIEKFLNLRINFADRQCEGRVAAPIVNATSGIDADHITLLEYVVSGDAVNDLLIYGRAGDARKGGFVRRAVRVI